MSVQPKRFKTLAALSGALRSMLKNRAVRVLAIDEAFHLLRFGNYSAIMDTIKTIADTTGTKIILIGTYDLFDLVSDYGQVARRSEILHFDRYHIDREGDKKEFNRIVTVIQNHWPCEQVPNFNLISNELMEASLGCLGLLKAIFLNSLALQLKNKGRWDPKFLTKAAKSQELIEVIRKEIQSGEKLLEGATYGESLFSGELLDQVIAKMNPVAVNG